MNSITGHFRSRDIDCGKKKLAEIKIISSALREVKRKNEKESLIFHFLIF